MHLKEMKNMDDMLGVLCELVEPMTVISKDPEMSKLLHDALSEASLANNNMAQFVAFLPFQCALLQKYRAQTVQMIASTTGRTPKEVEEQAPADLLSDVRSFITKDFLVFFR